MDLSLRLLADANGASGAFKDFAGAVTAAGTVVSAFVKDAVHKFAEGERAQRQLQLAAGKYTDALNEQAEAMKRKFAVDDDAIRQMDVLLLRYGAAPSQIEGATEAILNYAAATGQDATSAMQMLIRGVESGTGSLGRMGVHFDKTGTFAGDLTNAVDALGKKFGGAAEADANTLAGRMRAASLASDDFMKAMGAMFATIETKTGVLANVTKGINDITDAINKGKIFGKGGLFDFSLSDDDDKLRIMRNMTGLVAPPEARAPWQPGAEGLPDKPLQGDHAVGHGQAAAAKKLQEQEEAYLNTQNEWADRRWVAAREAEKEEAEANRQFEDERMENQRRVNEDSLALEKKEQEAEEKLRREGEEAENRHQNELQRIQEQAEAEQDRAHKRMEEQWRSAGDRIGAAMVEAIGDQLLRLAQGGDVDPADVAGDVVSAVLSVVGFAAGTYLGMPQLGGAIGGLAGAGAKAAIVGGFGRKKKHDGGWIERFHGGGWPMGGDEVPIIAQTGERVLSRGEVSRMGGPRGVDSAARGRGQLVMNISTIDANSFLDSFGDEGGRGLYNAIRVGRGDLAPLFNIG